MILSRDILSTLRALTGTQEPQMYCFLSMKLNDIDLLGSIGLNIDLGQCIMILTITKYDRENEVMTGVFWAVLGL